MQQPIASKLGTSTHPWMPEDFSFTRRQFNLSVVVLTNLGVHSTEKQQFDGAFLLRGVPPPQEWRWIKPVSGAAFFDLGNQCVGVLKPEVQVFPKIGKVGWEYENSNLRRTIPVMCELAKRGVPFEIPLAYLPRENDAGFVLSKGKEGCTLTEFLASAPPDKIEIVLRRLGAYLGNLHRAGVKHGHAHPDNWLVSGDTVSLIDCKACTFREEYPKVFKFTGRIYTWEQACVDELNSVLAYAETEKARAFVKEGYQS